MDLLDHCICPMDNLTAKVGLYRNGCFYMFYWHIDRQQPVDILEGDGGNYFDLNYMYEYILKTNLLFQ